MKSFIVIILSIMCISTFADPSSSGNFLPVSEKACRLYSSLNFERPNSEESVPSRKRRVVGGEPTRNGDFPCMAALGYYGRHGISFDCSGVIISDSYILTAAHCVANSAHRPDRILVGHVNIGDEDEIYRSLHRIERFVRHPEYSAKSKKNNIALIQLSERLYFSETIKPVCLETDTNDVNAEVDLIITGWGLVSEESRNRSETLLKASVKTMPLTQCNRILMEFNKDKNLSSLRNGISDDQYCAYDPNGVSGSCQGDSGGPLLLVGNGSVVTRTLGIISFGSGSCGTQMPTIHTRVAFYVNWIESVVWPNSLVTPPLINNAL